MKRTEPFYAVRKNEHFPGYYVRTDGTPLLATDGHVLVASTAALYELSALLKHPLHAEGGNVPPQDKLRTLIESASKTVRDQPYRKLAFVPDEKRAKRCEVRLQNLIETLTLEVYTAEQRLNTAIAGCKAEKNRSAKKAFISERESAKEALQELKGDLAAKRRELRDRDNPEFHALQVDKAFYDLRLFRKAMSALNVKTINIAATGAWDDVGVLYADDGRGLALVMPFRAEKG
jgi:hypothetical protein